MIEMHKKPIELLKKRRKLKQIKKRKKMRRLLLRKKTKHDEHDPRISCHVHVTNLFNI
jgi:hypothetical protein